MCICKSIKRCDLPLFLIIVAAIIVRLWGIDFGLPYRVARPDESYLVSAGLSFGMGSLNPNNFIYPSLMMYVLFFFYSLYFVLGLFGEGSCIKFGVF